MQHENDGNLSAHERHARRRAIIEAERQARREQEEELAAKRRQKKKSSSIPAKWHWKGGIKIAGIKVLGGFFYAGANIRELIEPGIAEPSLLNPTEAVAESSENMAPLGDYPMYQMLTPEQRRGYIEFLAGPRDEARDIGFVFIYLYGLERRLLIDAKKPGEVSNEERDSIIDELLRLEKCFGDKSRSLCHYIALLLLYEGSIFERKSEDELDEIFDFKAKSWNTKTKLREKSDNADAISYMLLSRMKQHKMALSPFDLISAGKGRLLRSPNAAMMGLTANDVYTDEIDALMLERLSFIDFSKAKPSQARNVVGPTNPKYYTGSPMIRKARKLEITSSVCKDPEKMGIPLKTLADMIIKAHLEISECHRILESSSLRDIGNVKLDALTACSPKNCPLDEFLAGKNGATYVPMAVLEKDLAKRFGVSMQYTSKGMLSASTQQLISVSAAALGWQAMLPEMVNGLATASWRVDENSKIVMFKRGTAHDLRDGRRCIGQIFGNDEDSFEIMIPGAWLAPSCLAYVFAWFVKRCGDRFTHADLSRFSSTQYPAFTSKQGVKKNQVALFFSILHATYALNLSTHGIKSCLDAVPFEAVQEVVFGLVNDSFGRMVPQEVVEALEDLYKKAGRDKSLVLYDYQAGDYHSTRGAESAGFFIDEEKLADTIADTSSVHVLLNDAMKHGEDDEIVLTNADNAVEQIYTESDVEENAAEKDDADGSTENTDAVFEVVKAFFGDDDEASTEGLLSHIVEKGFALTSAEAMGVIAKINDAIGEDTIEIDGPDVFLNI